MKAIKELRNRRAVSPVIATVILVAVTITVAVAVAYWMSGIAGQYTQFEKVEIQSGYAVKKTVAPLGWDVILTLKNSGTSTATLVNCFINEQIVSGTTGPLSTVTCKDDSTTPQDITTGITIESGVTLEITITLIPDTFSSSGTTINVKLHSAAGMDYIRLIQLP